MKKRITSLFVLFAMLFVQILGNADVKAADNGLSVEVVVESYDKVLTQGTSAKNDILEAAKEVMDKAGIEYKEETSSWGGKYISTINGVTSKKFSAGDGWMYAVNRGGEYVDTYAADFKLMNGDKIIFYFGIWGTLANKIDLSTKKPNENLTIEVSNYDSFNNIVTPLKGIKAVIYNTDNKAVFDNVLSDNKVSLENGLGEGTYRLELSDFQLNADPKVVHDSFTFKISALQEQDNSTTDKPKNDNETNNTKVAKDIKAELQLAANYIKNNSIGDPWAALSLNKLSVKPDITFIKNSAADVKKNNGISDFTNTELEKLILSLTASGYSPYRFMGYDLVSELYNRDINTFLINDAIYGLLVLNYANIDGSYRITKEKLVDFILNSRLTYKKDNKDVTGWALSGEILNPDITGLAINALSPIYKNNAKVTAVIDSAVNSLSVLQNESGYIADNFGYFSESLDMVILGLTSVGVSPEEERFTKAKGDLVSALLSFKGTEGQFKHSMDGKNDYIATEQALRALISLNEFKEKGTYNFYSSNIDSSKLQIFTISEEELLSLGFLPQTGGVLDFKVMTAIGIVLVLTGMLILQKKSIKIK